MCTTKYFVLWIKWKLEGRKINKKRQLSTKLYTKPVFLCITFTHLQENQIVVYGFFRRTGAREIIFVNKDKKIFDKSFR